MSQNHLTDEQKLAWLTLMRAKGIGPVLFRRLLNRYGGAAAALDGVADLIKKHQNSKSIQIPDAAVIVAELERGSALGCTLVSPTETGFPPLLRKVADAPPMLWTRGARDVTTQPTIAIVGSRQASAHGRQMARTLAKDLGGAGYAIISGFATGIDRAAHEGSLDTGTIASIAGGLGRITPESNADLIAPLCETGLMVSERPPDAPPRATDFPARNRIIAASAQITIVIEAARKSGSLITARRAKDYQRPVGAVPGTPMDPRSAGPNGLIKRGMPLIETAEDVISAIKNQDESQTEPMLFSESDADAPVIYEVEPSVTEEILSLLGANAVTSDALVRESGFSQHVINAALIDLELTGGIIVHSDGSFEKAVPNNI